jgi:hypothetical protein
LTPSLWVVDYSLSMTPIARDPIRLCVSNVVVAGRLDGQAAKSGFALAPARGGNLEDI